MKAAAVKATTLTPVWTGDQHGQSDHLRISGLMGSLRWWFEGLVRAAGYYACDPIGGGCLYDHEKPENGLCAACWLFGTTGWARRFRLSGTGLRAQPWYILAHPSVARMHESWLKRLLPENSQVLWGPQFELNIIPQIPKISEVDWTTTTQLVGTLLDVVSKWGAVGAKTQNGFGAVQLESSTAREGGYLRNFLQSRKFIARENDKKWFDLRRTIFLSFEVRDAGIYAARAQRYPANSRAEYDGVVLPIAYDIRYKSQTRNPRTGAGENVGLRPMLKSFFAQQGARNSEEVLGSTARSSKRSASRVFVTHLYRKDKRDPYQFRAWAHVPGDLPVAPLEVGKQIDSYIRTRIFPGCKSHMTGWDEIGRSL